MKLARPDVFHPRIVLAGSAQHPGGAADDVGLVTALRRRGLLARWSSWDDPETNRADLVILRVGRDYARRPEEFLAWTTRVGNLLNPRPAVAWNLTARYLGDLAAAGVPTLSQGTPTDPVALAFVGGEQSHAFTGAHAVEPEFEVWDAGHAALAVAADRAGIRTGELLYARVDVVGDRVAGLDVVAPELGWRRLDPATRDSAQRRFAVAVESVCERLGLGPFSHRGP
jgi:hypothetical protein